MPEVVELSRIYMPEWCLSWFVDVKQGSERLERLAQPFLLLQTGGTEYGRLISMVYFRTFYDPMHPGLIQNFF